MEELIEKCRTSVAKDGFYVQFVGPSEDEPSYAYSVGVERNLQHPEVIMVGFDPGLSHQLISDVVSKIREGERYDHPRYAGQIIRDFDVAFRPLNSDTVHSNTGFGQAVIGSAFEAVQLFLPDVEGRFPWDEGCNAKYARMQTRIFQAEGAPPGRMVTAPDPEEPGA